MLKDSCIEHKGSNVYHKEINELHSMIYPKEIKEFNELRSLTCKSSGSASETARV